MILEKHSKVASKSDESHFWSHLCQPCINAEVRFAGGRLSCTGAEVSFHSKDAVPKPSVQPHEGSAPKNAEGLVHCR